MFLIFSLNIMLYVDDTIGNFSIKDVECYLPAVSLQRAVLVESYVFCIDKELSLKAYQLLQKGLKEEYDISEPPLFEYNEFGKPSLAHYPRIHFNMSHCKRAVACLLANHPVGIDVEEITPFDSDVARYVLNSKEYDRVTSSNDPATEFTILWTMKESLIKLTGRGIDDELLPDLLHDISKYNFQTNINKEKGYVVTTCCLHTELL